jgi:LytS/YehU family sensor histidine kinase
MAAVLTAGHLIVGSAALAMFQPYLPVTEYSPAESLAQTFDSWIPVDPLIFAVLAATGYGLAAFRITSNEQLRQSRLQALLAKAELDALRLRIQPHFLFNTLNGIAALVRRREDDQALEMLLGLSDLLRATLEHDDEPLVPLGEELGFTRRYLRLQQIRFEDRLRISVDAPDDCLAAEVPFLLLQPLAENAIQHGIARRAGAGAIDIAARRDGGRLILTVSDDGAGLPAGFSVDGGHGVGLANTRAKLAQIYPAGRASLEIRPRPEGGTTAVVSLPLEASA